MREKVVLLTNVKMMMNRYTLDYDFDSMQTSGRKRSIRTAQKINVLRKIYVRYAGKKEIRNKLERVAYGT